MTSRTVKRVVRGPRRRAPSSEFSFTGEMVPKLNGKRDDFRAAAWSAFQQLPLPNTHMEPWRRTDLRRLDAGGFRLPAEDGQQDLSPVPEELLSPLVGDRHGGQIVIQPGQTRCQLDPEIARQGVIFTDYATAVQDHAGILQKIRGQVVRPEEGKFAALTAALARDGLLLYVPKNVIVEQPLHAVIWAPGIDLAHLAHIMVLVEDGAQATFVLESASPDEGGQTLNGAIVEMQVGRNANLRFVELQSLGSHVWNFSHERIQVARDGNADWIFGAIGSHLTKNFSDLNLNGTGANGRMSGFYFTDGQQHLDHDTQQNHNAAHTTSDLLFKGALRDHSRSVWQGMIYVAPGAQKTDGYQANRNLVLDKTARADSIPGLEILADDVRCTHGATVGKIDPELVFYLKSRGIPQRQAERLVVEGFFDPIMQRIPFEGVRDRFQQAILKKMG